jgi:DNA-binding protein YbaB
VVGQDPNVTLKVYADLFDTDLDALADVLSEARTKALKQATTTAADMDHLMVRTYRNRVPEPKAATGPEMSSMNRNCT